MYQEIFLIRKTTQAVDVEVRDYVRTHMKDGESFNDVLRRCFKLDAQGEFE